MERSFKGIWIPKEVWLSKDLTLQEKVFFVEIDSLDNEKGCFASNGYFAEFFGLSKNRCSEVIKSLEKKKLIKITYKRNEEKKNIEKRIINVLLKSNKPIREIEGGIRKVEQGYSENSEGSNTSINNTFNKEIVEIVNYLNERTGKKFSKNTKATIKNINGRLREGRTLDDFRYVIDNKSKEWKGNSKMDKYLRPDTLFLPSNFESYINENPFEEVVDLKEFDLSD